MCRHPWPRVQDHQLQQVQRPDPRLGVRRPEPRQQQRHEPLEMRDHEQAEDVHEGGNPPQPDQAARHVGVVELHVTEEEREDVGVPVPVNFNGVKEL